ncbi:hypothetical protein [Streptomyces sp. NBC_01244]|uniref:hypothetical protein n=1 Tax=Streptomyces sp. NBC_01244 TaxID=2903797 RepID=UPI003FA376CA
MWSDEFDGPAAGKPDQAKWRADPGTGQNGELEYYTDHQMKILCRYFVTTTKGHEARKRSADQCGCSDTRP